MLLTSLPVRMLSASSSMFTLFFSPMCPMIHLERQYCWVASSQRSDSGKILSKRRGCGGMSSLMWQEKWITKPRAPLLKEWLKFYWGKLNSVKDDLVGQMEIFQQCREESTVMTAADINTLDLGATALQQLFQLRQLLFAMLHLLLLELHNVTQIPLRNSLDICLQ